MFINKVMFFEKLFSYYLLRNPQNNMNLQHKCDRQLINNHGTMQKKRQNIKRCDQTNTTIEANTKYCIYILYYLRLKKIPGTDRN